MTFFVQDVYFNTYDINYVMDFLISMHCFNMTG